MGVSLLSGIPCKKEYIIQLFHACFFSIVKTITLRCRGRPDALLHEAEGRVQ